MRQVRDEVKKLQALVNKERASTDKVLHCEAGKAN